MYLPVYFQSFTPIKKKKNMITSSKKLPNTCDVFGTSRRLKVTWQAAWHIKLTWSKDEMLTTMPCCRMWLLKMSKTARTHETFLVHHRQSRAEKITCEREGSPFWCQLPFDKISCPGPRFDHIFSSLRVGSEAALFSLFLFTPPTPTPRPAPIPHLSWVFSCANAKAANCKVLLF